MKFLVDTQAKRQFWEALRAIGWDVATVYDHNLQREKDDARILHAATRLNRVMITFDYLRGQQGVLIHQELRDNGGRLLRVSGGPEQSVERALGRLLFHHPDWAVWLNANEGKVVVSDLRHIAYTARSDVRLNLTHVDEPQFIEYLQGKDEARKAPIKTPRRRRRETSSEQSALDLYGGPSAG